MLLLNAGADITAVSNNSNTVCDLALTDDEAARELLCP